MAATRAADRLLVPNETGTNSYPATKRARRRSRHSSAVQLDGEAKAYGKSEDMENGTRILRKKQKKARRRSKHVGDSTIERLQVGLNGARDNHNDAQHRGRFQGDAASNNPEWLNREQINKSFNIAVDKYKKKFGDAVNSLEALQTQVCAEWIQIFQAAGYFHWLKTHYPEETKSRDFHTINNGGLQKDAEAKLRDLMLYETIWGLSEHVRTCPGRIVQLFHKHRKAHQNTNYFSEGNKLSRLFYQPPYPKEGARFSNKGTTIPPHVDVPEVKKGIAEFITGDDKLNFDDIDECGRFNIQDIKKTYIEPPKWSLYFLILKYCDSFIMFKMWCVAMLYFTYESRLNWLVHFRDVDFMAVNIAGFKFQGIALFTLVDMIVCILFLLNDWILRFALFRVNFFKRMDNFMRARLFLKFIPPLSAIVFLALGAAVFAPSTIKSRGVLVRFHWSLVKFGPYYLIVRIVLCLIPESFPFSPSGTAQETKCSGMCSWKKRYFFRLAFFIVIVITTMGYEYGLIVPSISPIVKGELCGFHGSRETTGHYASWLDTQYLLCFMTTLVVSITIILAIAMDYGLAFIVVLSLAGWVRGYQTQGPSMNIKLTNSELFSSIKHKLIPERVLADMIASKLEGGPDVAQEMAECIWAWVVEKWRAKDYISDLERDKLLGLKGAKDGKWVIDSSKILSHDAKQHISFWLSSLQLQQPVGRILPVSEIPSLNILIPTYADKLRFKWQFRDEFEHMVSRYPEMWLNFKERVGNHKHADRETIERLENIIMDKYTQWQFSDKFKGSPEKERWYKWLIEETTTWMCFRDQYVEKTIQGADSYYHALTLLAYTQDWQNTRVEDRWEKAERYAASKGPRCNRQGLRNKLTTNFLAQVILAAQRYVETFGQDSESYHYFLRKYKSLRIVINFERSAMQKLDPEHQKTFQTIPQPYNYATCLLSWDHRNNNIRVESYLPREYKLRVSAPNDRKVQGKSMNQSNGMTFAWGNYIQVLDANQGADAPEYLKMPLLLNDFKLKEGGSKVRYRIIGSREYIFTKEMGTVAKCHAYQEWSFGTIVLRIYSDLGVRLHYGHPDVFHAPWATAHFGLSKCSPDIHVSEDVFAGIEAKKYSEHTKHLEHMQVFKGRETGLANMSTFDSKISLGNPGIMRSRDTYALMDRLDFIHRFLFFFGISGHFTTIAIMMFSIKWYLMTLLLLSLQGQSLRAYSHMMFGSEWLIHAGYSTVIPLVVEFFVEYGVFMGILQTLLFVPLSTIIYLFQSQTKYVAFVRSIHTGRGAHINTGRGLAIYRSSFVELFENYAITHIYPTFDILLIVITYLSVSSSLHGGNLPLIMIFVLILSIFLAPMIFNPTLRRNTLLDLVEDIREFIIWVSNIKREVSYKEWIPPTQKTLSDWSEFWAVKDTEKLPTTKVGAVISMFVNLGWLSFWCGASFFFVYPHMQFWLVFMGAFVLIQAGLFIIFRYFFFAFVTPLRFITQVTMLAVFIWQLVEYSKYGLWNFGNFFIPLLIGQKILSAFKAFVCDIVVLKATTLYKAKDEQGKNKIEKFTTWAVVLLNNLLLFNVARVTLALFWGCGIAIVAFVMRPFVGNVLLFGWNSMPYVKHNFRYLNGHKLNREYESQKYKQ